jgi:hypothetical protein
MALQYKILKPYTLALFEPTIFCSGDGRDDHTIYPFPFFVV